ncbi:MAG: ribose 5-phosphate isomerase B [candidate division WOR-3 bacterium]|jgi:ribose 5-phosphate isomerase B
MKIAIGADHRGYRTKSRIIYYLRDQLYEVLDCGAHSETSVDYPDFAISVAEKVAQRKARFGILLCYSGQGMVMAANKVRGIRAAFCVNEEYAKFARAHNDANVLVMPAGFLKFGRKMKGIIDTFLNTKFEGGRHLRRVKKIKKYEGSTHSV